MANLFTLDDYKDYRGLTNYEDDDKINILIPAISSLIKAYTGNSFVDYNTDNGPKVETFTISSSCDSLIFLEESPIISVTTVEERQSQADSYVELVNDGTSGKYEYVVDTKTGIITRTSSTRIRYWPKGFNSVRVTYLAGYDVLPEDLKLACYDLVRYYLQDEYKLNKVAGSNSIVNPGSSSVSNDIGFPDHIRRVLDLYRELI